MGDFCLKCGAPMTTYDTPGSYETPVASHLVDGLACRMRSREAQLAAAKTENAALRKELAEANTAEENLAMERINLQAIVDKLRFVLCPHCRQGVPLVNGWHKTESLCECEPNEFTDERSTVGNWVICPVEVAKEQP